MSWGARLLYMNNRLENLYRRFEELEVPDTQRFSTGPEETAEIGMLIDDFFDRTIATLNLSQRAIENFLLIEYRTLCIEGGLHPQVTDDFDSSLWLKDVQPLVSIRNVRDEPNFQVILFSKYSLAYTAKSQFREIVKLENK